MRNASLIILACLAVSGCATRQQTEGTAAGAVGGALVGGPIGAVVGGAAGAIVAGPEGPLGAGTCYARDRYGNIRYHSNGRPRVYRC